MKILSLKIILHRLFTWIINEYDYSNKDYSKLFKIFKRNHWYNVLYGFYITTFRNYDPKLTYDLIAYVWRNIFDLMITCLTNGSVVYKIKYNDKLINDKYYRVDGTYIFINSNTDNEIDITNYILGSNTRINFPEIMSISNTNMINVIYFEFCRQKY